jgi:hypothetical protein
LFSNSVAWFIALKIVLYALVVVFLPKILNNAFASIVNGYIDIINTAVPGSPPSLIIQFTGVAGAALLAFRCVEAFGIIVSAMGFKLALKLIPFLRF